MGLENHRRLNIPCFVVCFLCLIFFLIFIKNSSYRSLYFSVDQSRFDKSRCQWKFDHYAPSEWESYWYNDIDKLQNEVCSTLSIRDQLEKSIKALEKIIDYQRRIYHNTSKSDQHDRLFSKMHYRYSCSAEPRQPDLIVAQYIEPLIGLLRDPSTICSKDNFPQNLQVDGEAAIQSKRFFLLGPSAPYENYQTTGSPTIAPWLHSPGAQKILFDLGASLFNGVDDPIKTTPLLGARWFYEYFQQKSLQFDRIVEFEYGPIAPKTFWRQIPDDIIGKMTFINVGVETAGKFNPWNILRSIAKPEDYVIIKLDIDTPTLENELIRQVLTNETISSLIDEMFFEMHIDVAEMRPYWGPAPGKLKDSYETFTKLRKLGIRMHSWP